MFWAAANVALSKIELTAARRELKSFMVLVRRKVRRQIVVVWLNEIYPAVPQGPYIPRLGRSDTVPCPFFDPEGSTKTSAAVQTRVDNLSKSSSIGAMGITDGESTLPRGRAKRHCLTRSRAKGDEVRKIKAVLPPWRQSVTMAVVERRDRSTRWM